MNDKVLFSRGRGNFKIKVGRITRDENTGEYVLIKHKPHFMRVIGGYGIQKYVEDEMGQRWDLQEVFRKHPEMKVLIKDGDSIYTSHTADWLRHFKRGNYGDGEQMFLSVTYMKHDKSSIASN